jgi:PiT family inorganic phosphate transporter
MMNSWLGGQGFDGVNWGQLGNTLLALFISPIVGFVAAAALLLLARRLIANPALYRAPEGKAPPPLWIRAILVVTCTGVSFAHGSNDGQKGMGLIMLVLIGLAPAAFALHLPASAEQLASIQQASRQAAPILARGEAPGILDDELAGEHLKTFLSTGRLDEWTLPSMALKNRIIGDALARVRSISQFSSSERSQLRSEIYILTTAIDRVTKSDRIGDADAAVLDTLADEMSSITDYIPLWVKIAVALSLGLGTMIGWRRIVQTIGEKIGQSHLTYAQGASAEMVAMGTIGVADLFGVPVSTTHVLSSGIAGTMYANRSGLQRATLRNILLAWVLTIPACMLLGSVLFAAGLFVVLRVIG